ncbi:Metallo-dependent phosphatase-like protein [Chytridium lagenaria]|nr:Metallo-dependent phosphatase-like protein [Chytridium lagenaria]
MLSLLIIALAGSALSAPAKRLQPSTSPCQRSPPLGRLELPLDDRYARFPSWSRDMKRKAEAQDVELFVVDSGDIHDGSALADNVGDQVNGIYSTPMMLKTDYDVLALGNHELYVEDVARDMKDRFGPAWGGKYLATNSYVAKTSEVDATGKPTAEFVPISDKYRYFTGSKGSKVLSFGFLYNFTNGITKFARVKPMAVEVKEQWFIDTVTNYDADFILLAGHCGLRTGRTNQFPDPPMLNGRRRRRHPRHQARHPHCDFRRSRHARDYITFGPTPTLSLLVDRHCFPSLPQRQRPTFNYHLGRPLDFSLGENAKIGQEINGLIDEAKILTNYSTVYGCAPKDLYLNRVPPTDPSSIFYFLGENLARFVRGAGQGKNPVYVVVNGGGQRYDIFAGEFTVSDSFQAMPFLNSFRTIRNVPFSVVKKYRAVQDVIVPPRRRHLESSIDMELEKRQTPQCPYKLGYVTSDNFTATQSSAVINQGIKQLWPTYTVEDYVDKSFSSRLIWPWIAQNTEDWKC